MLPRHRAGTVIIAAAALFVAGLIFGKPPTADCEGQPSKYPRQILIIRHAEKPTDETDIHLSNRGAGRAAALPSLFVAPPEFPAKTAPFPTPDFIIAARQSKNSNRSVETVTPLARALKNMPIEKNHADKDFAAMIAGIFSQPKYVDKTILICWHRGNIPELARAVVKAANGAKVEPSIPKHWQGAVFDRGWLFTFDEQGVASFSNLPQRLLFGDAEK